MGVETGINLLKLESGGSVLELAPDIGGGISRLAMAGREVLRRAAQGGLAAGSPLSLSEFPMAPWVNRVAGGRFVFEGGEIDVGSDPDGDPLGLHGLAWRLPWSIAERRTDMALLRMNWTGEPRWPFPFEMTRRFTLEVDRLTVDAVLRNLSRRRMPAALGFHPYFPSGGAVLRAPVEGAWIASPEGIPLAWRRTPDADRVTAGVAVGDLDLDLCFTGWSGGFDLAWPTHRITIETHPPARFLQIYAPAGADYICVEPQTAMPDALNRDPVEGGLAMLAPLDALTLRLQLRMSLAA